MHNSNNETRQKLIEVGAALILKKSYHGVGLKEILDATNVPKGSFYNYFASKEDFGITIIKYYGNIYYNDFKKFLMDKSVSPRIRLAKLFLYKKDTFFSQGCSEGCLIANLTTELSAISPRLRNALKEAFDGLVIMIADCIREGQQQGEFENEDPIELAEFIINSWEGAVLRMQTRNDVKSFDFFIKYIFDNLFPEKEMS
jgi:TetR/AcrR family transcriptional regulator, transcriptional repressor for nem operon